MNVAQEDFFQEYLPEMIAETKQFRHLATVEKDILWKEQQTKKKLIQNQWILTATREGLQRRGKFLKMMDKPQEDLEEFRQRLLLRWNEHCPYTYPIFLKWLDGICGKEDYTSSLQYEEYHLQIILSLRKKFLQEEVQMAVRKMIPANLSLEVLLEYNRYGKVKHCICGMLQKLEYRYLDLREKELSIAIEENVSI